MTALFSITILILISPQFLQASTSPDSYFYPKDSKPFGKSYQEWAATWWKFVLEKNFPADKAPGQTRLNDTSGKLCDVNQTGNVWILPGAQNAVYERNCTIPKGVSLLISPTDGYCNKVESPDVGDDVKKITDCAMADVGGVAGSEPDKSRATLDGVLISDGLNVNRFQSVPFDLHFPWGKGPYKTVADGVYLMLKPLPPGNHTLVQQGGNDPQHWAYQVKYNLLQR